MVELEPSSSSRQPEHFTYASPEGEDLCQGDVLAKAAPLRAIIERVHPHYLNDDYTHFLVLTQSCDLVRRPDGNKKACEARYISLAPVRPLSLVLQREIGKYQGGVAQAGNVCSKNHKLELIKFLSRLMNNNDPDYFYLHEEPNFDIGGSSCAFLRLSISLRAYQHYEECLGARVLSLDGVFQAKLGWLVGNAYSRVGTPDWAPSYRYTKNQFTNLIKQILNRTCEWVDHQKLEKAETSAPPDISTWDRSAVREFVKDAHVLTKRERVLNCVINILKSENIAKDIVELERVRTIISKDPEFLSNVTE